MEEKVSVCFRAANVLGYINRKYMYEYMEENDIYYVIDDDFWEWYYNKYCKEEK